jgi:hypothetical protein
MKRNKKKRKSKEKEWMTKLGKKSKSKQTLNKRSNFNFKNNKSLTLKGKTQFRSTITKHLQILEAETIL